MQNQNDTVRTAVATAGPARSGQPVVEVRGLTKRYGDKLAVAALTFSLERGTVTGFLGPNGAGKSTTMRLLLGLCRPTAGEALLFGQPYHRLDRPSTRVGAVLESSDFDPGRSGRNHLRTLALAANIATPRIDELLALVELEHAAERPVRGYSLGMRQRLGLAAALLGEPDLLILDEPANGLDAAGIHWLRAFLRDFAAAGRTVLISSHVLAELSHTIDAMIIIEDGRLLAHTNIDQIDGGAESLESFYLQQTSGRPA